LLNPSYRFGASKARFFAEFGFTLDAWEVLALALQRDGWDNEVSKKKETGFGPRCEVEGELAAPDGRRPRVPHGLAGRCWRDHPASDYRSSDGSEVMIHKHACVVLTQDIPDDGLKAGDVGTVVHIHRDAAAYEIEFMTLTGRTVAVVTVLPDQLLPVSSRDVNHVRELAASYCNEASDA
jgi:hypothetical protein